MSKSRPVSDSETIKKTFVESTKRQRAHWVRLMLAEKQRTGDESLNLSSWIIRQLPQPDVDRTDTPDRGEG